MRRFKYKLLEGGRRRKIRKKELGRHRTVEGRKKKMICEEIIYGGTKKSEKKRKGCKE